LQGFAIAGGSSLALACDFLVAGENAFMHVSEVERNMLAPLNVFWLTQRYGYQVALRMGLLGQRWAAPDLLAAGLIEQCVPDEQVVDAAMTMASRFASFEQQNVRALKRSIQAGSGLTNDSANFAKVLEAIKTAAAA
ncbi:MAG: enoyl-CoA hydratase/isomerase family protein, partial [Pseudomonadales bacterium]